MPERLARDLEIGGGFQQRARGLDVIPLAGRRIGKWRGGELRVRRDGISSTAYMRNRPIASVRIDII